MHRIMFVALALLAVTSQAHPPRVKPVVHASRELTEDFTLAAHFLTPNLMDGVAPILHLELVFKATGWLKIAPAVGLAFKPNEAIVELSLAPSSGKMWGWAHFEVRPQSMNVYWFVQAQYKLLPWLEAGIEEESWGNLTTAGSLSHGAGPNVLLRLSDRTRVDFSYHARVVPGKGTGAEFFLRWHLFL